MAALPKLVAHAKKNAPGFARAFKDVRPQDIKTRKALAKLPVTRKSDLGTLQKEMPPLGGLNATPVEKLGKLFVSPGPIYDPEGRGRDWWRSARGLFAGGFRAGERGITVTQMYGSADLGVIAYESLGKDGTPTEGMILEESLILEIVRPGTGDPVPEGEVGEVVITTFNKDYPLIRFATGDLSAVL